MNVYVLWFISLSLYFWYFTEIKLKHASLEYDGFSLAISFSFDLPYQRREEILETIHLNSHVMPVYVLLDGQVNRCDQLKKMIRVECQHILSQPSYFEMLQFASGLPSTFVVLSNADILFNKTIYFARQLATSKAYVISWSSSTGNEETMCKKCQRGLNCWPKSLLSIDSYVFRRESIQNISDDGFYELSTKKQFLMNRMAAEFSFIGALENQGIYFENACKYIKTKHRHKGHVLSGRHYREPILFSKYGMYNPNYPKREHRYQIIYDYPAKKEQFRLPLGI